MDQINSVISFKNYYSRQLAGNPKPLPEAKEPKCVFYKEASLKEVEFSIVMPIYNQSKIIVRNLESIVTHTGGSYEIILIIDACSDNTEEQVLGWVASKDPMPPQCNRIVIIKSETPLFECSADNIGFTVARGKYLLEIQADMTMTETGYNILLRRPFEVLNNVIAVSGRCCHGLRGGISIGRYGTKIEEPYDASLSNKIFYVNETCNRGPLLLCSEKVRALGYLDEQNFYLDNSDHDLIARAWLEKRWVCGYVPINFLAPVAEGSMRKPRDPLNTLFIDLRRKRSNGGMLFKNELNYTERIPSTVALN
jgi:glycosyltransferase involved in cell wall biosynthesis